MKLIIKILVICLCLPTFLFAKPLSYTVNSSHSTVGFSVKNMRSMTVKGQFKTVTGNVLFDAKNPKKTRFEGGVLARTINTKNKT
ncbi:hypothetical protein DID80_07340 [Candidatus Marinamargulisbacteria bacterium SCGC AAA071-K20]|nr:hypothetical protein DID80_07340 [Candidatus Marinamargulisbacteria bacterium SCGC AAA071-K20]